MKLWKKLKVNIFRLVMRAFRIGRGAPYKGICAHCDTKVYHYYPWFTKNPKEDSAKPLHEECANIYLFGDLESETISTATYYKFSNIGHQKLTDEEVLALAEKTGTFDFLDDEGESIYTVNDGVKI